MFAYLLTHNVTRRHGQITLLRLHNDSEKNATFLGVGTGKEDGSIPPNLNLGEIFVQCTDPPRLPYEPPLL